MKTKNIRKKALVSSVAMLLVDLVALSGATYAWFASNTAAKASGLNFKSSQPSSLLFADTGSDPTVSALWTGDYDLPVSPQTTLTPCSSLVGATGSFIEVKDVTAAGTESETLVKSIGSGGSVYSTTFDVKSTANKPVVMVCLPENTDYTVTTSGNVSFDKNVCTIRYDGAVCDKVEFKKKNS